MKKPMMLFVAIAMVGCSGEQDTSAEDRAAAVPDIPVREHMATIITPATNTIWGIDNPQTDEEWQVIDDAAVAVIDAITRMKEGGTGPNDVSWAANADWDNYMDAVIGAAKMVRGAVANRSVDGVYAAGDVLYPPCEECHRKYHPEVSAQ